MVCTSAKDIYGIFRVNLINRAAQALSTPLRHCRLTDSRLPSHFLLSFGITKHPITGVQWHSPRIAVDPLLMSKEDEAPAESSLEHENADETPEVQPTVDVSPPNEKPSEDVSLVNQSAEIKNLDESPQNEPSEKLPSDSLTVKDTELKAKVSSPMPGTRKAASSYFICSQPAMKVLSGFSQRSWMNAIPHTWKSDSGIRADKLVWRKDMDGFVLELLRKKTFALLKMLASSRTGYITSCAGYNSVGAHNQVAAALWLGASTPANITGSQELLASSGACTSQEEVAGDLLSPGAAAPLQETTSAGHNSTPQAEIASSEGLDPPSYAMIKYKSHYIPFYNLPMLLGSEYISRLRAYIPFAQGTMALIKNKQRTVKAQMELWKLMGYMAQTEILEALESKVQSGDRKEGRKGEDGKGNSGKEKIGKGEGETGESEKAKDEKDAGREAKERISKTLTKTKTETVKKKPKEEKASPSKEKRSEKRSEK